jgi:hypothetical protein
VTRGNATVKNFQPVGMGGEDLGLDNDPMYYLTRLFVYFLQNLYRDFPEGYGMKWRPNVETSELAITSEKPKLDAVEKRPHITCVLGSARFAGLGLDQLQTQRASDGQRTHTDLVPMTMGYYCQAKSGLHARRLAWNSSLYTTILRRVIMRVGGLFQVGVQHDIGTERVPQMMDGNPSVDTDIVEVPVIVPFYWQPQWRIRRASEVWRRMVITMNVNGAAPMYSAGRAMKVRPPMVKGVPVTSTPLPTPPSTSLVQKVEEDKYFEEEE